MNIQRIQHFFVYYTDQTQITTNVGKNITGRKNNTVRLIKKYAMFCLLEIIRAAVVPDMHEWIIPEFTRQWLVWSFLFWWLILFSVWGEDHSKRWFDMEAGSPQWEIKNMHVISSYGNDLKELFVVLYLYVCYVYTERYHVVILCIQAKLNVALHFK